MWSRCCAIVQVERPCDRLVLGGTHALPSRRSNVPKCSASPRGCRPSRSVASPSCLRNSRSAVGVRDASPLAVRTGISCLVRGWTLNRRAAWRARGPHVAAVGPHMRQHARDAGTRQPGRPRDEAGAGSDLDRVFWLCVRRFSPDNNDNGTKLRHKDYHGRTQE